MARNDNYETYSTVFNDVISSFLLLINDCLNLFWFKSSRKKSCELDALSDQKCKLNDYPTLSQT